jgi:hypothetical protein
LVDFCREKLLNFALNKLSTEKVLRITRLENILQVLRTCGASADASALQTVLALAKWHFLAL